MNLIDLKPYTQKKLFGYDNFFFKITNLHEKNMLPNKILLSGPKGVGKATFAYHLINYIFSKDEEFAYDVDNYSINDLNHSFKLVKNNSHPNFFLIDLLDDKKTIEISQVREMINYVNKSALNNKERVILIDNAEYLNLNSSNALLKIIEEPNDNVFFILIHDINKKILETIKSRCLKFNLSLSFNECINIVNKIINCKIEEDVNFDLINHYYTVGDFVNLINFSLSSNVDINSLDLKNFLLNLIENKYYKKNIYIKKNIYKFSEYYLYKLISIHRSSKTISKICENLIKKIYYLNKYNLDDESFFIELKTKVLNE